MHVVVKEQSPQYLLKGESECCPPVVDPTTLGVVLAGIGGLFVGLRQLVVNNIMGKRRRKRNVEMVQEMVHVMMGKKIGLFLIGGIINYAI